jgi:hypothetical protein
VAKLTFAFLREKQSSQKSKAPTGQVEAFDWDGMGGNIGGLFVYVLALKIMYYLHVELQWRESELPVTRKFALFRPGNHRKNARKSPFPTAPKIQKSVESSGKNAQITPLRIKGMKNAHEAPKIITRENEKKRLAFSSPMCIIIFALGVIAQLVRALR